jgi:ubiquinone biosynthesis protein
LWQGIVLAACGAGFAAERLLELVRRVPADERRSPRWWTRALAELRGPFAKVGQLAGLRVDLLAPEVREGLLRLRDRVPPLPFARLQPVIEAELGLPLTRGFRSFSRTPLGAASIAQAHAAELPDGTPVVVKIQYPWLGSSRRADLVWLRLALALLRPRGSSAALTEEFGQGLGEELDFRNEARVAQEIAENLAADERIVVPRVLASHSTARVLTVERHPTLPLEREALLARGVDPAEIVAIVVRAYAQQIFGDGLFHADPHPGNLFVIDAPDAATHPRVLFVDFGLSKRLPAALRNELRLGIYALLQGDLQAFLEGMQRLGMLEAGSEAAVRQAVERMFERIRGEAASPLGLGTDRVLALKDEAQHLLYETPGLTLPRDLLLYAKTVSTLFALGRELAPDVDLMKLTVPYLLRFLAAREPAVAAAPEPDSAAIPRGPTSAGPASG